MADAYGLPDTSVLLDAVLLRQEENLAAALARRRSPDPAVAEYGRASTPGSAFRAALATEAGRPTD